ncbi:uncharacterized protein LOC115278019 [Suricata suricatta]|uniref:uncharacterized protein LOC115278019 n=1 Tax=Suricata suricatta TaxID=37032 RepID=UPI001156754B|nr:uncharacterized protein LOC115278019 [Suricata suricatta]
MERWRCKKSIWRRERSETHTHQLAHHHTTLSPKASALLCRCFKAPNCRGSERCLLLALCQPKMTPHVTELSVGGRGKIALFVRYAGQRVMEAMSTAASKSPNDSHLWGSGDRWLVFYEQRFAQSPRPSVASLEFLTPLFGQERQKAKLLNTKKFSLSLLVLCLWCPKTLRCCNHQRGSLGHQPPLQLRVAEPALRSLWCPANIQLTLGRSAEQGNPIC